MVKLDPDRLAALAAAVDEGTYEAAARRLHVTPSAISLRVKALETTVGRVLLTRTKPVRPTASGEALLRAARQLQLIAAEAARALGGDGAAGLAVIPLAVNADTLATWLVPALASAGSDLVFDIRRDDQDRTADLLREGTVMAAVTSLAEAVPGCSVQPLGQMRYRPRCSPSFAASWFPDGPTPASLSRAPLVVFDRDDQLQERYLRRRARRRLDPPRHLVPGSEAFVDAVALGLGWGMVPDLQAGRRSDLVELDPGSALDLRLFWQQWRLRSAVLERVARAVRAGAAASLR